MFHCLPNSAWANGNLAEAARQLGKIVEHPTQSQPNPGLRADGTPCILLVYFIMYRVKSAENSSEQAERHGDPGEEPEDSALGVDFLGHEVLGHVLEGVHRDSLDFFCDVNNEWCPTL